MGQGLTVESVCAFILWFVFTPFASYVHLKKIKTKSFNGGCMQTKKQRFAQAVGSQNEMAISELKQWACKFH